MHHIEDGLVSIVVPVYNAERFLEDTVRTVQNQTYQKWELLLVDDCSKDESRTVILQFAQRDDRIRLICQETNQGAARARNRGVKEAKGRYLCFLDADDIWEPNKLQEELAFMNERQAGFVFTGYEFADETGRGLGKVVTVPEQITYREALKNTTIFTSTVMFDRKQIENQYLYMPEIPSEDTATWWQILKRYGVAYGLNQNLVKYRRSENTLSSNKWVAIQRIWDLYRKQEGFSVIKSMYCMFFWAVRAVLRRV
ncbi:MAG: glycosyltransferase family 2 protein [Lachnospiraceae bacterium]|nr:glycosyltransferase family 2 protein [Lachnospiraceae bacterium]